MIRGIGVDTVDIRRIESMQKKEPQPAFLRKAYTSAELAQAPEERLARQRAEYLAARFAAKEAVFKAVAHLTPEQTFNLRLVETLRGGNGCPYVNMEGELAPVFAAAGVTTVHISLTTEGDYATAFAVACDD